MLRKQHNTHMRKYSRPEIDSIYSQESNSGSPAIGLKEIRQQLDHDARPYIS